MVNGITDFGKDIKRALIDKGENQAWLIKKVSSESGLYFDSSYLCKIMTGKEKSPVIIGTVCNILGIEYRNAEG